MEIGRFVRLRGEVWDAFEAGLGRARARPRELRYREVEELALRYRQVLHDHALAAARWPGTGVAARLRRLALEGAYRLTSGEGAGRRPGFYTDLFPRAFRAHLRPLAVAVALFAGAAVLGLLLATVRPGMGAAFLGPEALAGLRDGKLWTESLVTTTPPAVSSSGIATNNLSVALTAWAGGALAGLGAFYVTLLNGFMLGAIVGVTLHFSMAGELLGFVAAHGPLELTLIVVSAAAGLGIGRALVAADDRPRSEAVPAAARQSLILMLGCLPWLVVLAVVEVLLSPSPEMPVALKVAVGAALELSFLVVALQPLRPEEPAGALEGAR
jgi:uncharacterized membrane protein SpoIIM required for sporulation